MERQRTHADTDEDLVADDIGRLGLRRDGVHQAAADGHEDRGDDEERPVVARAADDLAACDDADDDRDEQGQQVDAGLGGGVVSRRLEEDGDVLHHRFSVRAWVWAVQSEAQPSPWSSSRACLSTSILLHHHPFFLFLEDHFRGRAPPPFFSSSSQLRPFFFHPFLAVVRSLVYQPD